VTPEKKARLIAAIGSRLMRLLFGTLRFRIHDRAGILAAPPEKPLLWAFWHNQLFLSPYFWERFFPARRGAALASQSKDGEIIAAIIRCFGLRPIRGSSSRGGGRALVEMKRALAEGFDVAITPDGPRGPCYQVNPGVVKLAQLTGGFVLPMRIEYSRCWRLKSWDGFMIPQPFAVVDITLDTLHRIADTATDEEFENERAKLERLLLPPPGG
jgi:lysophospholipid acyltransferase (LPLAT)-like uncharacterized protein